MNEIIFNILKKVLQVDNVNEETSQNNTFEWDSLKHLMLVVELESAFDVEFEPEEIADMKSFKDIKRLLQLKTD